MQGFICCVTKTLRNYRTWISLIVNLSLISQLYYTCINSQMHFAFLSNLWNIGSFSRSLHYRIVGLQIIRFSIYKSHPKEIHAIEPMLIKRSLPQKISQNSLRPAEPKVLPVKAVILLVQNKLIPNCEAKFSQQIIVCQSRPSVSIPSVRAGEGIFYNLES